MLAVTRKSSSRSRFCFTHSTSLVALLSSHIKQGRSGFPRLSNGIPEPPYRPLMHNPATPRALILDLRMTSLIVLTTASNQTFGHCSAQRGLGRRTSYSSKVEATIAPSVPTRTVFVPRVPTSVPIRKRSRLNRDHRCGVRLRFIMSSNEVHRSRWKVKSSG